jgi:hypothetical protein
MSQFTLSVCASSRLWFESFEGSAIYKRYLEWIFWFYQIRTAVRGCIEKSPDWVENEIIHAYNNKHSLRSNAKGYGGKTHYTDSQNSDTTAPSGRELYHLQFSFQAVSPETFGYTLTKGAFHSWVEWSTISFECHLTEQRVNS